MARLFETRDLARVVPHLAPETLHRLIRFRGLDECGALLAAVTPEQMASVLDFDLWRAPGAAGDEQFDHERFGEWLEALAEAGDASSSRILAGIDVRLLVAGLARYIRVLDPAACARPDGGEAMDASTTPFAGLATDVGGYVIRARTPDAWDEVVAVLLGLEADDRDRFDAVMRGCRRLSSSAPEADGLDDLLTEPGQLLHDLGLERERRRSQRGYLSPAEARAFLQMARQPPPGSRDLSSSINPIVAAYLRAGDDAGRIAWNAQRHEGAAEPSAGTALSHSIDAVADLLAAAGLVPERPRALPAGATAAWPQDLGRTRRLMEQLRDADEAAYQARTREFAFLANTLVAGCSVQSRLFSAGEASDATLAVCDLGLDHVAAGWPGTTEHPQAAPVAGTATGLPEAFLVDHDLVTLFQAGWAALHDVSMLVARRLIAILEDLHCGDAEIQEGLDALRRELARQCDAGTPWRARDALDVIAILDTPAWVGLLGLLGECPVVPAAVIALVEGRTGAVSASAFEFISTRDQVGQVQAFLARLPDILLR
jgi:hypothetical protein